MPEHARTFRRRCDYLRERPPNRSLDTALLCIVVDKRSGKAARDLWKDIKAHIEESAACVFDLTAFRPNVVLELGYAISIKAEDQIFITFRKRKFKGRAPIWFLSDIAHLNRHDYIDVPALETFVREQLDLLPFARGIKSFHKECESTNAVEKYQQHGIRLLQAIRDEGPKSEQQLQGLLAGSACRLKRMLSLLKKHGLVSRPRGRNTKYTIPELPE